MKKSVQYIGLDVHKETIAVAIARDGGRKGTDILAALARRSRKVRNEFLWGVTTIPESRIRAMNQGCGIHALSLPTSFDVSLKTVL